MLVLWAVEALVLRPANGMPSEIAEPLAAVLSSAAFALAGLWLISPYLATRSRVFNFFRIWLALTAIVAVLYGLRADRQEGFESVEGGMAVFLGVCMLIWSLVLALSGWFCRARWSGVRWLLAVFAGLLVVWTALVLSVYLLQEGDEVSQAVAGVIILSVGNFLFLLPYLTLSLTNRLYRERLRQLLLLPDETPA